MRAGEGSWAWRPGSGHGGRGGVAVPAGTGPDGGVVGLGEHQRGRAVPARAKARPGAARALPAACGGDWWPWRAALAREGEGEAWAAQATWRGFGRGACWPASETRTAWAGTRVVSARKRCSWPT